MSILTSILGGGDLIKEIGATVRQVLPNKEAQREFDLKIAELADKADQREQELNLGQIDVNKEEAKHSNIFVAGWRPAMGWVGAVTLAHTWIIAPTANWIAVLMGYSGDVVPALDADSSYPIILGMLGLGAQRSYEKGKGVATSIGGKIMVPVKPQEAPAAVQSTTNAVTPTSVQEDNPKPKKKGWFD
jgi:hypothetical protein